MRILLVEDDLAEALRLRERFGNVGGVTSEFVHVRGVSDALSQLGHGHFDAVLLDWDLPDARGLRALVPIQQAALTVPVVVLSGERDEFQAVDALQSGAQDFVVKGQHDGVMLLRALRYAVARKHGEEQTQRIAHHDAVTGLPDRFLLLDRLHQLLASARRDSRRVGVLVVGLGGFPNVSEAFGHSVDDRALVEAASRVRACVRESDTVARFGDDEFAIIVPGITHIEDLERLATKILGSLRQPAATGERDHPLSACMGISLFPDDGGTPEGLIQCAATSMHLAKGMGTNVYQFHDAMVRQRPDRFIALASELRDAAAKGQFLLHYQPQVDARTYQVVGFEALVRWRHPERGLIRPSFFIPQAESTGAIVALDAWVLREGCRQVQDWNRSSAAPLKLSVNLSARGLEEPDLRHNIEHILSESGFAPSLLELELTERGRLDDDQRGNATLRGLRDLGVHLVIDDFGTGRSSFTRLTRFPINALKIDQSHFRDIVKRSPDAARVGAITNMAHRQGLKVIQEGVEWKEQAERLTAMGSDRLQGYFFGRPQPAAEAARWLSAR
jgi:diguanylate cyclase (GGDEF)-like protein